MENPFRLPEYPEFTEQLSRAPTVLENKSYQYKDEEMDILIEEDKSDQFLTD
jgi:hypothetical protein